MTTPLTREEPARAVPDEAWRCFACHGDMTEDGADSLRCGRCGKAYPIKDGVVSVKADTSANNQVAKMFYDGPLWPKFRFWEWFTFISLGGERRANAILRYLPKEPNLKLIDVAIGDGVYLDWLEPSWSVTGIDVSEVQLAGCQRRSHGKPRSLRLVLGEAEELPFQDRSFDVALSIGGFNYFNDPEKSLREMARVVKPGGTIVVADEVPDLTDRVCFRKIGLPGLDRWIVAKIMKNLGEDFRALVERYHDMDVAAIGQRVLKDCEYRPIWRGVGYVMAGKSSD